MKIGSIDILKAYLGALELTNSNAFVGTIPVIENGPEPLDKDYFYLQPLVAGDYSISTNDEVWKQNNTFEFSLNKINWRKFSSLTHSTDSVGFDVYMTNNPNLVALALDINAYNEYVVAQNYIVGIRQMGGTATAATFLRTDENFAYYVGTLEEPDMMDFQWGFIRSGHPFPDYVSNSSTDRMFEWNGMDNSGSNTDISNYSSFVVVTTTITETISLSANDKLYLRNTSGSIHSGIISSIQSVNYNIGGIFNTLTDYTDDTYTITSKYADGLFKRDTKLISAGDLKLPATTLTDHCYQYMFQSCTSLTTAPLILPATTLANYCYAYMFQGCKSLTTAPEFIATTLADHCCYYMFQGCLSLTTAPELPATTLTKNCYNTMFSGCKSLTTAPELPATTLADYCYASMFNGCTKLNYIKCLATNISATGCTSSWVNGVASSGKFVKAASMTGWTRGTKGIPSGWIVQNAA